MTECFELTERLELCADYADITGKELPEHIRQARSGIVFGEPKPPKAAENSSLLDWDNQDAKNGNAYGS